MLARVVTAVLFAILLLAMVYIVYREAPAPPVVSFKDYIYDAAPPPGAGQFSINGPNFILAPTPADLRLLKFRDIDGSGRIGFYPGTGETEYCDYTANLSSSTSMTLLLVDGTTCLAKFAAPATSYDLVFPSPRFDATATPTFTPAPQQPDLSISSPATATNVGLQISKWLGDWHVSTDISDDDRCLLARESTYILSYTASSGTTFNAFAHPDKCETIMGSIAITVP